MSNPGLSPLERDVRQRVYRHFLEHGRASSAAEIAAALGRPADEIEGALRTLADAHVLVLKPGTVDLWMAMPFSAVETRYRVETPRGGWWANCAWDALGVLAMLGSDGTVRARCACCEEPQVLDVEGGQLRGEGMIHFAVPAARWWADIGFT